ncbi:MAG: A24 family peptidase [Christensenella sp.]|nr:A24 family peptidase [Christensenella sp.]
MMQFVLPILLGAVLGAALSVPVWLVSALLLRRRNIDSQLEPKYRLLLAAAMALFGGVIGWRVGISFGGLYRLLLLTVSACVFVIDAKNRVIPNELVLAILVLAAVFGFTGTFSFQVWSSLLGLAACFVLFFVPSLFGKNVGVGDVKLAAAMGFTLGLTGSLYAIVGMGVLVLAYLLLQVRVPMLDRLKAVIPMGPFLALALVVVSIVLP